LCVGGAAGMFDGKWGEVTRDWRRLHKEEFYDLYSSPKLIRFIKYF
jgi:hypothetical protein